MLLLKISLAYFSCRMKFSLVGTASYTLSHGGVSSGLILFSAWPLAYTIGYRPYSLYRPTLMINLITKCNVFLEAV